MRSDPRSAVAAKHDITFTNFDLPPDLAQAGRKPIPVSAKRQIASQSVEARTPGTGFPARSGFRNFGFGPEAKPEPSKISSLNNAGAGKSGAELAYERRRILGKLAQRLNHPEGATASKIPSGYTYLLQLIAHDMVRSTISTSLLEGGKDGLENTRENPLLLDTIFGEGPHVETLAYTSTDPLDSFCDVGDLVFLKLGPIHNEREPSNCPLRDLPRVGLKRAAADPDSGPQKRVAEALICDVRNDDHAIISQLAVVFHLAYNHLVRMALKSFVADDGAPQPENAPGNDPARTHRCALAARLVLTVIYREIIKHDLLPRIIDPAILMLVQDHGPFDRHDGHSIPVEFSHGAFRFGHAMIRESYNIRRSNAGPLDTARALGQSGTFNPYHAPIDDFWVVEWRHFYGSGDKLNNSRPLGGGHSPFLNNKDLFPPLHSDEEHTSGLAYRDLASSLNVGTQSVAALFDAASALIAAKGVAVPTAFSSYTDSAWPDRIKAWLNGKNWKLSPVKAADAEAIANDPPLPFFTQFEARGRANGTLGPLASFIVADTILGAIKAAPVELGGENKTAAQQIEDIAGRLLNDRTAFDAAKGLNSMPGLILYIAGTVTIPPPLW